MLKKQEFKCLRLFVLAMWALPALAEGDLFFDLLGEVDVAVTAGYPKDLTFSSSGRHLLIEYSAEAILTAVYIYQNEPRMRVVQLPYGHGSWGENDELRIRGATYPAPEDTFDEEATLSKSPAIEPTLSALSAVSDIYFLDGSGRRVHPGSLLYRRSETGGGSVLGARKLFLVEGKATTEITTEDNQIVIRFAHDKLRNRVCATTGQGCIIYDHDTKELRNLLTYDHGARTEWSYHLIPGEDFLLVKGSRLDQGEDILEEAYLEVLDLQGNVVSELPLWFEGAQGNVEPGLFECSQHLLAVSVRDEVGNYVVKVFRKEHK